MYQKLWHKDFVLILIGQTISSLGTTILRFAISLYILDLTGSGMIFGTVMAISIIPMVIISPFGGVLADRVDKGKMMVLLDVGYGLIALILGYLLSGNHTVILLSVIMILLSIVSSFELSVSQSAIPLIQTEDNLVKANAMVGQISMVSGLVGPILAGLLYSFLPMKNIALVSSIFFFAASILEAFIKIPFHKLEQTENAIETIKSDFKESLKFMLKEEPSILKTMLLIAGINLFISSLASIGIPYIIQITLSLDSRLNGIAQGAMAGAGIVGGVLVGALGNKLKVHRLYKLFVTMGIALVPLGISFLLSLSPTIIYIVLVVCFMLIQLVANILSIFTISAIQRKTPSHQLGRIMSFAIMLSMCAQPIGQLIYGGLFEIFANKIYIILLLTAFMVIFLGIIGKETYCDLEVTTAPATR